MVSQTNSSDYYEEEDSQFLEALGKAVLPGDVLPDEQPSKDEGDISSEDLEPPPSTQPGLKRRWSDAQQEEPSDAVLADEDTYRASRFGGFGDYMRRKRAKLQIQNADMVEGSMDTVKSQIFEGLSIYINGWTKPSVQDLRQLIVHNGGTFQPYLDKKGIVTHIVTCSLTPAKVREFKHMKVVRPEWLVDSVGIGYLLPWKNYIYIHEQETETSKGRSQMGLAVKLPQTPSSHKSSMASDRKKPLAPDPLYTTDPVTKADAARIPGYAADKSNPNAQRVMANPEWRKAHTSISSDFIEGYYKNSRLHHLSTWKAELKHLVQEAQERAEAAFNSSAGQSTKVASDFRVNDARSRLSMRGTELVMKSPTSKSKWKGKARAVEVDERVIMHCDFDCFFVAAGLVSRPKLKGKAVVVCHSQGTQGGDSSTSEIASSSYEARKFGIKNGMSLQQARKLCPELITIPYEFERYKQLSVQFYTVLMSHADDLQAVSVDEALIDVSTSVNELRENAYQTGYSGDPAKDFAEMIRDEVRKATTCEISIGVSHNILLARLATRRAKPGGSFHLTPAELSAFLAPLDICDLHGFGWSTKRKAQEKLGVTALGELVKKSKSQLIDALGKATGETLYNALRGIDDRKLESDKPRKSVSCEINYGIRFENNDQAETFVRQMASEVKKRLDVADMIGRSITLKIMKRDPTAPVEPPKFLGHGACDVYNKQIPLVAPGGRATSDETIIGDHAWRLLKSFNFDPMELRGIGIHIQKLESTKSTSSTSEQGQVALSFKPKVFPQIEASKEANQSSTISILVKQPGVGDPTKPRTNVVHHETERIPDLPSFSQVDMTVLEALPKDVRAEIENEYKRRSASPFPVAGAGLVAAKSASSRAAPSNLRRSATPNVFPQRKATATNARRITQQLAPRSRSSIPSGKSALYSWAQALKPKAKKGIKVSEKVLRELNLDPEVFFALPIQVQSEQLAMARILRDKGSIPEPPRERKILKPRKHELPPDFVPYIAPKPKARHPTPPCLRQNVKGKKLAFTETDDVQRVVETWVMTYHKWAPREKDVEFLSKYLVQSVDRSVATDVGVERAIAVMKWWLVLLRRLFPASEVIDDDDLLTPSERDTVGEAWWATFRRVKEKMDQVTRKRFGGVLGLK